MWTVQSVLRRYLRPPPPPFTHILKKYLRLVFGKGAQPEEWWQPQTVVDAAVCVSDQHFTTNYFACLFSSRQTSLRRGGHDSGRGKDSRRKGEKNWLVASSHCSSVR